MQNTEQDNAPKAVDVDKIDLEKERIKVAEHPGIIPLPHSVGSAVIRPEDAGKIKGRAVAAMKEQTDMSMAQLYRQMQTLADQAFEIQQRVKVSERIYVSKMSFEPIIGREYYLYQRKDGTDTLSMVAPNEWGRKFPFEHFLARVKLLSDHTWDILEASEHAMDLKHPFKDQE